MHNGNGQMELRPFVLEGARCEKHGVYADKHTFWYYWACKLGYENINATKCYLFRIFLIMISPWFINAIKSQRPGRLLSYQLVGGIPYNVCLWFNTVVKAITCRDRNTTKDRHSCWRVHILYTTCIKIKPVMCLFYFLIEIIYLPIKKQFLRWCLYNI